MRFVAGFLAATLFWGGLVYGYTEGLFGNDAEVEPDAGTPDAGAALEADPADRGKRRRKPRQRAERRRGGPEKSAGTQLVGDDLGLGEAQKLDLAAGEQQLKGTQIEAGFDATMPAIRRCLVLVPTDGALTGQLTFGMRVGRDGKPKAVNLSGPSVVVGGESGQCLRHAAQGLRFAPYNGPDTVFKYPVTLH